MVLSSGCGLIFHNSRSCSYPTTIASPKKLSDADLAIAWSLRGDQITAAKKLRWIHSTAAAVHGLMTPELQASDIIVTNARAVHGPVVAEHAMSLVFAMAKRLPEAAKFQAQRHWAQQEICETVPRPRELKDATMVIVGFGSIGTSLAELAALWACASSAYGSIRRREADWLTRCTGSRT